MVIDCRAMVSVMSSPDTVGSVGRIPGEIVCAQAGSQADNAAPPPARPRRGGTGGGREQKSFGCLSFKKEGGPIGNTQHGLIPSNFL
jgi:hypothetical protein